MTSEHAVTRSWWGWGAVEAAVRGPELDALLGRVALLAPDADLTPHEPPDVASLALPDPRVTPPSALAHLCSADPTDRAGHAHGKAFRDVVRNLQGVMPHAPDMVARPSSERDVVDLLDWCSTSGISVIPYGGGSSVVGGIEPRYDGPTVTVDLGRLSRVLEVDRTSRAAQVQAGVLGPHLEEQLRPYGLTMRFFPQSFEFSTLGGWLATRAGGHYATLHTHVDDLVESLRVVTPAGISESRRLPASGAGPSPDRLFLGSEGALGVLTEAWVRLQDRPRWRARASVQFVSWADAVAATRALAQSGLHPSNCRLLDPTEALLNAGASGSVLVVAFESADHPVDTSMDRALELVRDHRGEVHARAESAGTWKASFLRMPYQRDALARHAVIAETFETAVTWDRFESLHQAVSDAVGPDVALSCRLTHVYPDGAAPYFGVYAPGRWDSLVAQWDDLKAAVSDAILRSGGTITHHHAVGRDHGPWYDAQRPDLFATALGAVKDALDPAGVMNPGVLVPVSAR